MSKEDMEMVLKSVVLTAMARKASELGDYRLLEMISEELGKCQSNDMVPVPRKMIEGDEV